MGEHSMSITAMVYVAGYVYSTVSWEQSFAELEFKYQSALC